MGKVFGLDVPGPVRADAPVVTGPALLANVRPADAAVLAADLERMVSCPDCGLPAEVVDRFSLASTDGAIAHVALGCLGGHFFRMAVERLPAEVPPPQTRRR